MRNSVRFAGKARVLILACMVSCLICAKGPGVETGSPGSRTQAGAQSPATGAAKDPEGGNAPDPQLPIQPSWVDYIRPIIGAGFTLLHDDYVDFKSENDVLLTENDSRLRATLIAGFFTPFSTCSIFAEKIEMARYGNTYRDSDFSTEARACHDKTKQGGWRNYLRYKTGLHYSFQFTQGSRDTISGFSLGMGFKIRPGVYALAGYSVTKGNELSYGFRASAIQAVKSDPQTYARFKDLINQAGDNFRSLEHWDGFLLTTGSGDEKTRIFPGNPIVESYNSAWTFGIAIPLDAILRTGNR